MSLIQEALKRQQEESGEIQPEEITPQPSEQLSGVPSASDTAATPPPLPTTPMEAHAPATQEVLSGEAPAPPPVEAAPPAESGSRTWPVLLGVLVVTVVLIGAGIWAVVFAFHQLKSTRRPPPEGKLAETVVAEPESIVPAKRELEVKKPSESASTVEPTGPAAKTVDMPAPSSASAGAGGSEDLPPSRGIERSGLEDELAKPESAEEAVAKRGEEQIVPVLVTPVVTEPKLVTHPPTSQPEPVKKKPSAPWPSVSLSGLLGKGSNGSAILNNRIIGVGETIDGIKVVSIGRQGVVLEYKGETQLLQVGNSTR